uniref:Uncharacterized protein n=1 Tax=Chromera velia CCMP2878 TaxID=1169474 RepID=A0A0G4I7Z4_9ALVE|eukprot:Cvel_11808.t1-p1 / transcript=Cvel_11808.t1 / gene=Cvel_11808 / organism=Chromera_velia_CCMP2878 / gene_product=hypothetical protein / transcript_product=hypothetical protein / location=Cvel_scaffold751:42908-47061(+) / protein_length=316 / sequence_SO=supercontig / SO=protein_coding / is_pseudo=false
MWSLTLMVSFWLLRHRHAALSVSAAIKHGTQNPFQKVRTTIQWMVMMVPVYTWSAFLALVLCRATIPWFELCIVLREFFESYVVLAFILFCLHYLTTVISREQKSAVAKEYHPFVILHEPPSTCCGRFRLEKGVPFCVAIFAMWYFFKATEERLKPVKAELKFLAIKGVVAFCFWQGLFFNVAVYFRIGYLEPGAGLGTLFQNRKQTYEDIPMEAYTTSSISYKSPTVTETAPKLHREDSEETTTVSHSLSFSANGDPPDEAGDRDKDVRENAPPNPNQEALAIWKANFDAFNFSDFCRVLLTSVIFCFSVPEFRS